MSVEVGKYYRTPCELSAVVRVIEIDPARFGMGESAFVEFITDHPHGEGSNGRYPTKELDGREVVKPDIAGLPGEATP